MLSYLSRTPPEADLTFLQRLWLFSITHINGLLTFLAPVVFFPIVLASDEKWVWCAYVLLIMGVYWVSECIPLPVTGFLPVVIFPLVHIMSTDKTCECYMNDSIMMFLGSIILAYSVEQSGLHKRLAYCTIRMIGYSHLKLLLAICVVTTFVSMWVTNTAATTMMIPICFAILKVFENEGILKIYDKNPDGTQKSSKITACYFCSITFSATIGGIGTLVGTATNLVFKGLFMTAYPSAPEYLSFPKFSAFATPYMVAMEVCCYIYLAVVYFGYFRPGSPAEKSAKITDSAQMAARKTIERDSKNLGKLTYWEVMVILLFGGAIVAFFCRSPKIFTGWGDIISDFFDIPRSPPFPRDSALAMFVAFLMFITPCNLKMFCKHFNAKFVEDLPKTTIPSVVDWKTVNKNMPYAFMFLLGGGVALSHAADKSGLNVKIGTALSALANLPNLLILLLIIVVVVFITNFASNVAVCNVFGPIAMSMAKQINQNPLWYILAAGFSSSYCFMLPVGTPGNLIVQTAAKVPTSEMMIAGFGPTITTILLTWLFLSFYAPIIWPDLVELPEWATAAANATPSG